MPPTLAIVRQLSTERGRRGVHDLNVWDAVDFGRFLKRFRTHCKSVSGARFGNSQSRNPRHFVAQRSRAFDSKHLWPPVHEFLFILSPFWKANTANRALSRAPHARSFSLWPVVVYSLLLLASVGQGESIHSLPPLPNVNREVVHG